MTGSSSPTAADQETPTPGGPFAPLCRATFRSLWLAALASNIGDWMENVGSAWLMTELSRSATLVGLVQTSSSLPFVLFVLPAGALADIVDRRKLLLATQVIATVVLVILAILTALGGMTPALLLLFTFAIGSLAAAAAPSWQAIVPDLVPRDELRSAVALNSASVNVARAVGPAIAGVLITIVGVAAVYAGNAFAFLLVVVLVARWKAPQRARVASPERLAGATRAGIRYARASLELRAVLYRTALFAVPASAIWALLPIVVRVRFGDDGGLAYGVLLALLGGGAIVGIVVMPRLRAELPIDRLIGTGSVVMAAILVVIGVAPWPPVLAVAALAGGVAWVTVVTNVSAAAQFRLPDWVRARGLGAFRWSSKARWRSAACCGASPPRFSGSRSRWRSRAARPSAVWCSAGIGRWKQASGSTLNPRPSGRNPWWIRSRIRTAARSRSRSRTGSIQPIPTHSSRRPTNWAACVDETEPIDG